jgi:hypothetical protein
MAIQPIDLQTLFTQVDKVGKAQSAQREGLAVQQALQSAQHQRKIEEHIQEVNEAQDSGDGAEKINERNRRGAGGRGHDENEENPPEEEDETAERRQVVFSDPLLGKNIDISL